MSAPTVVHVDSPLPPEQVRLRCLELAVSLGTTGRIDADEVVGLADDFETFITG